MPRTCFERVRHPSGRPPACKEEGFGSYAHNHRTSPGAGRERQKAAQPRRAKADRNRGPNAQRSAAELSPPRPTEKKRAQRPPHPAPRTQSPAGQRLQRIVVRRRIEAGRDPVEASEGAKEVKHRSRSLERMRECLQEQQQQLRCGSEACGESRYVVCEISNYHRQQEQRSRSSKSRFARAADCRQRLPFGTALAFIAGLPSFQYGACGDHTILQTWRWDLMT